MEGDLLGLDFTIFHIHLVANEDDGDVLAYSGQILVPLWDVLISDSRADVKHDDTTVTSNIVSISESSKLLLSSSVPNIE